MAFYKPKIKWYHRLWNIIVFPINFTLLTVFIVVGAIPVYIVCGDKPVGDIADHLYDLLNFTDN
jgi:hypothetical protein